jgi:hypothetical protein
MTETVDRTIERVDPDTQEVSTRTIRYEFVGNELYISEVTYDAKGNEQVQLGGHQPWQCMPDGSRQEWANAEAAFAWADEHLQAS